jgi:hypothetical protein
MKITTVVPFPPAQTPADELKINRRTASASVPTDPAAEATPEVAANAAAMEVERRRIEEDSEVLRLREANLREYEARLRVLQSEMDARGGSSRSATPFSGKSMAPFAHDDAGLEAAWQKLHRAREFTEAEQAHLRDDRLAMHAFEVELKQREAAVAAREARVTAQEEMQAAQAPRGKREPMAGQQTLSAFTRLTRAPFKIAESLRGKSDKEKTDKEPRE